MGIYVIARTVAVADIADLGVEVAALRRVAVTMTAAGQPVRILHCTYVPADQRAQYAVAAEDPATVIEALRRTGTTVARVLPALEL